MIGKDLIKPKRRKVAVVMALIGTVTPLAGLHKFYLGQPLWGMLYLLLFSTPIAHVACAIEAVWYLTQDQEEFELRFNREDLDFPPPSSPRVPGIDPKEVVAIADALRELEQLRQEGLLSEYEFEQKRRQLIDKIN